MSEEAKTLIEELKTGEARFANFIFVAPDGTFRQITMTLESLTPEILDSGIAIDGSSIPGWKQIEDSDLRLKPDFSSKYEELYSSYTAINFICDVVDTDELSYSNDPRSIARRAEAYLTSLGFADLAIIGPELEYYTFDSLRFSNNPYKQFVEIENDEALKTSAMKKERGNHGYRTYPKSSYNAVPPLDTLYDLRSEVLMSLAKISYMSPTIHHHEVGNGQCEIGFDCSNLLRSADKVLITKGIVKNTSNAYGKTATFMPKPLVGEAGSGMHCHISLMKNNQNLFAGSVYSGLSQMALYFIGGISKHIRALLAFTNSTTNSYKRLRPGFEAPIAMSYSKKNRSNCIRIPHSKFEKGARVECRFPDCSANPYLAFSAILLAGLDGIKNQIDPGPPTEVNFYDLVPEEMKKYTKLPANLLEAINALEEDSGFLTDGGVFPKDFLNFYINSKINEHHSVDCIPTPGEFEKYYNT